MRLSGPLRPSTGWVATNSRTLGGRLSTTATCPPGPRPAAAAPQRRTTARHAARGRCGARPRTPRRPPRGPRRMRGPPLKSRCEVGGATCTSAADRCPPAPRTRRRTSQSCPAQRQPCSPRRRSIGVARSGHRCTSRPRMPRRPRPNYTSFAEGLLRCAVSELLELAVRTLEAARLPLQEELGALASLFIEEIRV